MKEEKICIKALLPALIETEEQRKMTEECRKSIISFDYCLKVEEDNERYATKVAGVWNNFFKKWVNGDYDYLLMLANDTILDPMMIDYGVQTLLEHPDAGVCTFHVTRDLEAFKLGFGQQKRSGKLTQDYSNMDPANFLIRKGVLEKVGLIDENFPCEFVERDLWRRCELAGFKWIEPIEVLNYHPPFAGTIGNDDIRLQKALVKYVAKWGGDAGQERFLHPYNDYGLDYKFTDKYL